MIEFVSETETGILGRKVYIYRELGKGVPQTGIIAAIYSTRRDGPSFKVRILWNGIPRGGGIALKRNEFTLLAKEL